MAAEVHGIAGLIGFQVITTSTVSPRLKMQMAGFEAVRSYEREAMEKLRRMSIAAAELEVKGSRRGGPVHEKFGATEWYESQTVE